MYSPSYPIPSYLFFYFQNLRIYIYFFHFQNLRIFFLKNSEYLFFFFFIFKTSEYFFIISKTSEYLLFPFSKTQNILFNHSQNLRIFFLSLSKPQNICFVFFLFKTSSSPIDGFSCIALTTLATNEKQHHFDTRVQRRATAASWRWGG